MEQTTLASSSSVVSLSLSDHRHERPIRLKETRRLGEGCCRPVRQEQRGMAIGLES